MTSPKAVAFLIDPGSFIEKQYGGICYKVNE